MLTYKIYPINSEFDFAHYTQICESDKHKRWCVHDNFTEYNIRGFHLTPYNYNADIHIFRYIVMHPSNKYDVNMVTRLNNHVLAVENSVSGYLVGIYDTGKCVDSIVVMVDKNGVYYASRAKHVESDGWPEEIPEIYKSECTFNPLKYPTCDLFCSDLKCVNNSLYLYDKLIDYDFYCNEDDVCEYKDYTLYIHVPFNVCDMQKCKHYIEKYKPQCVKVVTDSKVLSAFYKPILINIDENISLFSSDEYIDINNCSKLNDIIRFPTITLAQLLEIYAKTKL